MYPSINNNGNISFTSINVQPMTLSFENDVNLSKLIPREHYCPPSSSSFHLFSPHYITLEEHETIYNDHLPQQQNLFSHDHNNHHHTNNNIVVHDQQYSSLQSAMKKCSTTNEKFVVKNGDYGDKDGFNSHLEPKNRGTQRRITSKKDRHSKINTARGPRDRRMRLSIDVAKKFFKLQDMLGFDKASKTVEWLLMKSKSGIQELLIPSKLNVSNISASSTTTPNCELVLSGNIDNQCMVIGNDQVTPKFQVKPSFGTNCKEKKKSGRKVRKSAYFHSLLAKETREKARARARERTVEKISKLIGSSGGDHNQCSKSRPCLDQVMDQYLHLIGPSSTIDQLEQQSSNLEFSKQGFSGDDSSLMTANWSPTFLFNYQHAEALLQEQQFNEFQILGNLWEGND